MLETPLKRCFEWCWRGCCQENRGFLSSHLYHRLCSSLMACLDFCSVWVVGKMVDFTCVFLCYIIFSESVFVGFWVYICAESCICVFGFRCVCLQYISVCIYPNATFMRSLRKTSNLAWLSLTHVAPNDHTIEKKNTN